MTYKGRHYGEKGLDLKIKSQFSPPPYAFSNQKDAPGWVWGFLDAT